jgi:acetolactate decarboxylase
MKKILLVVVAMSLIISLTRLSNSSDDRDVIFQTSTINALFKGIYDGDVTYKELKKYGDFGLGTFNSLDGEMIALNGKFYQIKADGKVYPVDDSMKTPFATVTFFEPDRTILIKNAMSYETIQNYLDSLLPSNNIFYSIKLEGVFKFIKLRSVPRQEKPYQPLTDALKKETVFELKKIKGTAVGFRMPGYIEGLNLPGYHLHFITDDKKMGGHLLDCLIQEARIEIDLSSDFYMTLPETTEFRKADLEKDNRINLDKTGNGFRTTIIRRSPN